VVRGQRDHERGLIVVELQRSRRLLSSDPGAGARAPRARPLPDAGRYAAPSGHAPDGAWGEPV
ncbi:MAG: hypothetical protein ACYCXW_15820, partial [Solirubrobacteraceae bacterium]